jgi:HAMP domain-containing protein
MVQEGLVKLRQRVAAKIVEHLSPAVTEEIAHLQAEVSRLTVDNARLQGEVTMLGELFRKKRG